MRYILYLALISTFTYSSLQAQELSYGFKAGLNFSTFQGPLENGENGESPESYDFNSGFHIGIMFNRGFTDLFGIRAEVLYSQKGSRYRFEGEGYQLLQNGVGSRIFTTGNKEISLNITNAYIDVPISAYGKVLPWLELHGGISVGAIVSSSGTGELRYSGVSSIGVPIEDFLVSLDHRYYMDVGGFEELGAEPILRNINGDQIEIPRSLGAYYDYEQGEEVNLFNRIDFGLQAGVSIFLNQGLFLGLKVNYGLADITNNEVDRSLINLGDNNEFIFSEDVDRNLSLQASIGFSF